MADSPNDEDWVRSARAGDRGAFDRLVERHAPRLYRIARAQVGDATLAEDLVQETFLKAYVALRTFRFDARFFSWLYRILANAVAEHRRNTARRRELDARVLTTGETSDPIAKEDREELRRAMAELPEEFRTALILREWGDLTYAEIAELLGCPIGTVDSRIARARQMLVEKLK